MITNEEDVKKIEDSVSWENIDIPRTVFEMLKRTKDKYSNEDAVSFQILSDPGSYAETVNWKELYKRVCQTANFFYSLGLEKDDTVAFLLPNCLETLYTLIGGMVACKINPINPLISAQQIAGIMRSSNAKVLVTMESFPKTNIAQLAAEALKEAPEVKHVVQIGLTKYLKPPKSWLIPLVRPKSPNYGSVTVHKFYEAIESQNGDGINFEDGSPDRVMALFHTGGTTGFPKLVQHCPDGMIHNGWCGEQIGITHEDNVICPLPLFHAFAAYPILATAMFTGAHVIFPTPSGYRGDGVFDNFWKLVEQWKVTFMITVPTALAVLMQKPVNADVSTLKSALCGSAPLPVELFNRFEKTTGVSIMEGYGLTESTCIVSANPREGIKKIGSVGIRFPYSEFRILECDDKGKILKECAANETGEICISNPGVLVGRTYTEDAKNQGLYADEKWLRTGDLGYFDEDNYLWITGRAKDLIIRGGHNVDPAIIEEVMAGHPKVAFAAAVGQPDPKLGELPCVYLELIEGEKSTNEALLTFAENNIKDKLAQPVYVEILDFLPKTAVGKVFKPNLRKLTINRVLGERFANEKIDLEINTVEKANQGLVAEIRITDNTEKKKVESIIGEYPVAWEFKN